MNGRDISTAVSPNDFLQACNCRMDFDNDPMLAFVVFYGEGK
jgi:hypothetical protein